jgi:hypothetical protein
VQFTTQRKGAVTSKIGSFEVELAHRGDSSS